jgi:hypothetical protein
MKYYKKLDLEFETVAKKTLAYVIANKDKVKSFWTNVNFEEFSTHVPEIKTMFAPLNITPIRVSIVSTLSEVAIHRDNHIEGNIPTPQARINIPILNCHESETRFWSTTAEPKLVFLDNGTPYLYLETADCKLEDVLQLDRATVLRVIEPHSVHPGPKSPRVSLTIQFKEDIEYLLND